MLAICERLGLLNFADIARSIPIGVNRRRGAPEKLSSSRRYKPSDLVESDDDGLVQTSFHKIKKVLSKNN